MNRPDTPGRSRSPITGIPGRVVAVPVWLLLVAGAALTILGAGVGAAAGVLIVRATVGGQPDGDRPSGDVPAPGVDRSPTR
jgi:hypothetical protein